MTPRLVIRPMQPSDAADLLEVYGDVETMQFLTRAEHLPRSLIDARKWMAPKMDQQERDGISLWSVWHRADARVIGDCGLQWEDETHTLPGLGFRFNRAYWGQGLACEACAACLKAAFDELEVSHVVCGTDVNNVAARRLIERLGMRYARNVDWFGRTMAEYELSAEEWAAHGDTARKAMRCGTEA
ncbi:MAG TPA: GNAT family N-acetyltransferase [Candidatus Limnocylindria bacterium]|nr:GNAT family N-acetyltransferase [Candidatus Limnocylindria bacterium]